MRWLALTLVCAAVAGISASAATGRTAPAHKAAPVMATTAPTPPLATGLYDPIFQTSQADTAAAMASAAGASYVRLPVKWGEIAPVNRPNGFDPADPNSPGYDWSALDASVSAAVGAGLTPILNIVGGAPWWANAVQPHGAGGGTPKLDELGSFATAVATRYDGSGPEPAVHVYSVWNEPNFNRNLSPQSPATYRDMVNAVAQSVHGINPTNLVVAGELAPFKHKPSKHDKNSVIPPLAFMRSMLCISGGKDPHLTCNDPAQFDVWAHHPYSDTGPYGNAKSNGGVELGDLPAMASLLRTAARIGATTVSKPQFWVTEFGWSSNPPNTNAVPIDLEARWVAESLYQIWSSGATLGIWFLLQDEPLSTPFQSGLYFASGSLSHAESKPLLKPFRFPVVAYLKSNGKTYIWGRDATSDKQVVTIDRRTGANGTWKTVATVTSNNFGIFQLTLKPGSGPKDYIRASAPGSGTSALFALKVPRNEEMRVSPFPFSG